MDTNVTLNLARKVKVLGHKIIYKRKKLKSCGAWNLYQNTGVRMPHAYNRISQHLPLSCALSLSVAFLVCKSCVLGLFALQEASRNVQKINT